MSRGVESKGMSIFESHRKRNQSKDCQNAQGILEVLINFHDGRLVPAAVAIVWCREDGHDVTIVRPVAVRERGREVLA